MKIKAVLYTVMALTLSIGTSTSKASLILSDISFSSTELSLRVSGTAESAEINTQEYYTLFFGFDNGVDSSWITCLIPSCC